MYKEILGTVISVKKQWWLKINTKAFRKGSLDGAVFPHIIKVKYEIENKKYTKLKWINAGKYVPRIGENLIIDYNPKNPRKAKILL